MKIDTQTLKQEIEQDLVQAEDELALHQVKVKYLGKKGRITTYLKGLGNLSPTERPVMGKEINDLKQEVEKACSLRLVEIRKKRDEEGLEEERIDITLPGQLHALGKKHPLTQTLEEIVDIFTCLGFQLVDGPEVELDYYNFEALNIPKDHPARDMQDTFYLSDDVLLRTHTSPVQIRTMEQQQPPIRIICPGKAYRCDADISHTPMFHQVEGLLVDRHITFADLKGTLETFVHQMFGPTTRLRFRPSFFPFTEPSAEVDIACMICSGKGCRVCSMSGWLEILGAGMVDPAVYSFVHYDPEEFVGFAFGMGIERVAMLKYGINDIRLFFENDIRFLDQF